MLDTKNVKYQAALVCASCGMLWRKSPGAPILFTAPGLFCARAALGQGEAQGEGGARFGGAGDSEGAAMGPGGVLGDGQAQAVAVGSAPGFRVACVWSAPMGAGLGGAVEAVEQVRQVRWIDGIAGIVHGEYGLAAVRM